MLQSKQKMHGWRVVYWGVFFLGIAGAWFHGYRVTDLTMLSDRVTSCGVYCVMKIQQPIIGVLERIRSYRMTMHQLRTRVAELEHQNNQLTAELIQAYATNYDEPVARELAVLRERYACQDAIGAHVMMTLLSEQEHTCLVDAGEKAGVTIGMVAVLGNTIVGKVTHVYPWYSKVTLITDSSCKIAAYCAKTSTQCIHEGTMDLHGTQITHVHHYDRLDEGDMVLSSGQGVIFPHGFGLGHIRSVRHEGLWKHAIIEPIIDPSRLTHCVLFHKGQHVEPNRPSDT